MVVQIVYELCVVLEKTDAQLRSPPVSIIVYDNVTNSFILEICFWGPTYHTFLYNVTLFSLFFYIFPKPWFMKI